MNVREVIDEFKSQCESFSDLFEAFVLIAPGRISSRKLEIAKHFGFMVLGLPVEFVPVSTFRWVNITCLSYGVPDEDIREALRPYGRIKLIKHEQYQGVYTGVRNCLPRGKPAQNFPGDPGSSPNFWSLVLCALSGAEEAMFFVWQRRSHERSMP